MSKIKGDNKTYKEPERSYIQPESFQLRRCPDHEVVGEGRRVTHATCNGGFRALDVGRGVVGNPWVVGCEDLGFYKHGVLTAKGEVSIL